MIMIMFNRSLENECFHVIESLGICCIPISASDQAVLVSLECETCAQERRRGRQGISTFEFNVPVR